MHKNIVSSLKTAKNLAHVREELVKLFKATKNEKEAKIGYVAGIINSDGLEYFEINRKKLTAHVEKLRKLHQFPMFSAVDVFSEKIYAQLEEMELPFEEREVKMRFFWQEILKSGHVTDIFMTPGWERSKGAQDEHETAKEIGLRIHYIEDTH